VPSSEVCSAIAMKSSFGRNGRVIMCCCRAELFREGDGECGMMVVLVMAGKMTVVVGPI
jgi:hypothetical protein